MSKPGHITLNFNPILLDRMRDYARSRDMKINAVLKLAFELLEDQRTITGSRKPVVPAGWDDEVSR